MLTFSCTLYFDTCLCLCTFILKDELLFSAGAFVSFLSDQLCAPPTIYRQPPMLLFVLIILLLLLGLKCVPNHTSWTVGWGGKMWSSCLALGSLNMRNYPRFKIIKWNICINRCEDYFLSWFINQFEWARHLLFPQIQ